MTQTIHDNLLVAGKLYLKTPLPTDGMGIELYVNDQLIRRYSTFKNGIYFKVNDPQKLSDLRGGEVRFHRPLGTRKILLPCGLETRANCPPKKRCSATRPAV